MNPRLIDMTWSQLFWRNQVAGWTVTLVELAVVSAASALFLAVRARLRKRRIASLPAGIEIQAGPRLYSCRRARPWWTHARRRTR